MSKYKLAWFDKESRPVNVFFNVDSNKDAREFLEKFSEGMPYPISLYVDEDSLPEKLEIEALPELFEIKVEFRQPIIQPKTELVKVLCCPTCGLDLTVQDDESGIFCEACEYSISASDLEETKDEYNLL